MSQLCRIDLHEGPGALQSLEKELNLLTREIRQRFSARHIYVFGSFARGDVSEGSDIDLIVVGDFSVRFHKRAAAILELTELPVEPLCYTPGEWESMLREKNSFVISALRDAKEL